MENFEKLSEIGLDVDSLLSRLMGNASLVRLFTKKFIEDPTMVQLQSAFAQKDMVLAERASHTLKGVCGNLSLTQLYELFTQQVNLLRAGAYDRAEDMMPQLLQQYNRTVEGMKAFLTEN